jgi:acetate kinase
MNSDAHILVLNCGSSSLKFGLFDRTSTHCIGRGAITGFGAQAVFSAKGDLFANTTHALPTLGNSCHTTSDALHALVTWLENYFLLSKRLMAVGHRIVHGGDIAEPVRITSPILAELEALVPLAPLHQPYNIEAINFMAKLHPDLPQVACFDTSFHLTMPPLHRRFALPRKWYDQGVKRYGFHGISYEFVIGSLRARAPHVAGSRVIIAHLGGGASLCALKDYKSFDTSMGFSALDGLVMGTRPGTLDAGVLLYFLQHAGLNQAAIEHILYHESGLLGISNISADMATLLKSKESSAHEAIDLFCLRIVREAGGLISLLGGLDAFVFTGGIGEHAGSIRAQICKMLSWAGLNLDEYKNAEARSDQPSLLSLPDSKVEIHMIPTDEELVIARQTHKII